MNNYLIKKTLTITVLVTLFLSGLTSKTALCANTDSGQVLDITADACVVMEGKTGAVLYEKNKDKGR